MKVAIKWNNITYVYLILIVIFSFSMTACNKKQYESLNFSLFENRSMFSWTDAEGFSKDGYTKADNGIICLYEYGNLLGKPLCNKKECLHVCEKTETICEAMVEDLLAACIYKDSIYAFRATGWQEITVLERGMNESDFRILTVLPFCCIFTTAYNVFYDDKLYLIVGEIGIPEQNGFYTNKDVNSLLIEVNLKDGTYSEVLRTAEGVNYQFFSSKIEVDGIFCRLFYDRGTALEDGSYDLQEYREMLFYVPFTGKNAERIDSSFEDLLCAFSMDEWKIQNLFFGKEGIFVQSAKDNSVTFYSYLGDKMERVYTLPLEYQSMVCFGESGGQLLAALVTKENRYRLVMIDLERRTATEFLPKIRESYRPLTDGYFACKTEEGEKQGEIRIKYYKEIIEE